VVVEHGEAAEEEPEDIELTCMVKLQVDIVKVIIPYPNQPWYVQQKETMM
jgi:hypothetical protein